MNYWLIADTHLGHTRMQELCSRPKDADKMILHNCGDISGTLIHLGDVAFNCAGYWHRAFISSSACYHYWLLKGNHDNKSNEWYLNQGWDFVGDMMVLTIYGKRIAFSHKPLVDNGTFDLNIHGHLHNTTRTCDYLTDKHILIKCEHTYRPVNLRKLVEGKHEIHGK